MRAWQKRNGISMLGAWRPVGLPARHIWQGRWWWTSLTCLALLPSCATPPKAEQAPKEEGPPRAEEIIEKSIKAIGGKAAFERIHSRLIKATIEITPGGVKGTLTSYAAAPNKRYEVVDLEGVGTEESGSDGQVYWSVSAMVGPRILEGEEKAFSARESVFNSELQWRTLYEKVECVGTDNVDDHLCYTVVRTPKEGAPETVYYDQKTYLPVKTRFTFKGPMGEVPVELTSTDFKAEDGLLMPHKMIQSVAGGMQTVTMTMTSIKQNAEISADRFALPEPIKELLAKQKAETKPAPK